MPRCSLFTFTLAIVGALLFTTTQLQHNYATQQHHQIPRPHALRGPASHLAALRDGRDAAAAAARGAAAAALVDAVATGGPGRARLSFEAGGAEADADLNDENHFEIPPEIAGVAEWRDRRRAYLATLVRDGATVDDAITGRQLRINDQLLEIALEAYAEEDDELRAYAEEDRTGRRAAPTRYRPRATACASIGGAMASCASPTTTTRASMTMSASVSRCRTSFGASHAATSS